MEYHPPYSDVFTCTPLQAGEGRRTVGPTRFPVVVITCARGPSKANHQTKEEFRKIPIWRAEDQSAAADSLMLPADMPAKTKQLFKDLFWRHELSFAQTDTDLGCCTIGQHSINIGDAEPIKQRPYRHNKESEDFVTREIASLESAGLIEKCNSPFASPVVVVEKKEARAKRMCVDMRRLNAVTIGDSYPMPDAQGLIADLEMLRFSIHWI